MGWRYRTLEELDGDCWCDEGKSPYSSGLWGVAQATRAVVSRKRRNATPVKNTLGSMDLCWCGQPRNHDWAGQAEGAPHPRGGTRRSSGGSTRTTSA